VTSEKADPSPAKARVRDDNSVETWSGRWLKLRLNPHPLETAKGAAPKPCTQALSRSPKKIAHFSCRFRSTPFVARLEEVAAFFHPAV
jgi:hypothetical protein